MNNAHNKIDAAASAQVSGRYSLVRRVAGGCLLACAFASAAHAGPEEDQRRAMQQQQRAERQAQERHARQFDTRQFDARAEEQRRQMQMQQEQNSRNAENPRRGGHLTPDERRDLRRQINEAGMDLYPHARRR